MAYSFEEPMGDESHNQIIKCMGENLVPTGTVYDDTQYASCAGVGGAIQGQTSLTGDQYIASLNYKHNHLWRSFGIV